MQTNDWLRLPNWLRGDSLAIIVAIIALGAMTQAGFINLRMELRAEIDGLRTELRAELRAEIADVRRAMEKIDDRLRAVKIAVAGISVRLARVERLLEDRSQRLHDGKRDVAPES